MNIARYFLLLAAREPDGALLTQMHLHKLLYYAQGWSLAVRGRPLFADRIEAWQHGPVVKQVFPEFADYKGDPIPPHHATDEGIDADDRSFVDSVWATYKRYSAIALRNMTHRERPWLDARGSLAADKPSDARITDEAMASFFKLESDKILKSTQRCLEAESGRVVHHADGLDAGLLRASEESMRAGRKFSLDDLERRFAGELPR